MEKIKKVVNITLKKDDVTNKSVVSSCITIPKGKYKGYSFWFNTEKIREVDATKLEISCEEDRADHRCICIILYDEKGRRRMTQTELPSTDTISFNDIKSCFEATS